MTQKFIYKPQNVETIIITELEKGHTCDINSDISIHINADPIDCVTICEIMESNYIRLSHKDFKKMIDVYNEIIKKIDKN
jgi:hypothetical protein